MAEEKSDLKLIVEAALFAAESPLGPSRILSLFPVDAGPSREEIKTVLKDLEADYEGRGIELKRVGKAYRFQSREKYSTWLRKLNEGRSLRYTRALLETLAIVAYRQPVTRGDIEEIRGVTVSSETMRTLLDREWIRQVGQREVPGRPALFGTTQQFLEYFNLTSLSVLPPLVEKREPAEIARELNLSLPLEETIAGPEEDTAANDEGTAANEEIIDACEAESVDGTEQEPQTAEIIHLDIAGESEDELSN